MKHRREIVVLALLALLFAPAIRGFAEVWSEVEYLAHGYLIVPVALMIVWGKRAELARLPDSGDARGGVLLVALVAAHLVALASDALATAGLLMVLALGAAVWWLRGVAWLRALAMPLAYLVFMLPIPPSVVSPVITRLRLVASEGALRILQGLSLPVAREGNVLLVPDGQLFVAEACSGITSVVSLMPVALLLGYYTPPTWPRRLLLLAAVVPLAILGNLVRLVVTVVGALEFGIERATQGPAHDLAGMLTFAIGTLGLVLVDGLMRRWLSGPSREGHRGGPAQGSRAPSVGTV